MRIRDLVNFIRANRGRAAQMEDLFLVPYILFHYKHGAVKVIEEAGKITGFAVGRRTRTRPIDGNFSWGHYYESGQHFIIGDLIATTPTALSQLAEYFLNRWPSVKHIYGHNKDGSIKELSREFIRKLRDRGNYSQSTAAQGYRGGDRVILTSPNQRKAGAASQ